MDGHYARKYKMVSKFGDYFDHIKDVLVVLSLIFVIFYRYKVERKVWVIFISIMFIFSVLMIMQLGCQEKLYPSEESPTLSNSKNLCFGDAKDTI